MENFMSRYIEKLEIVLCIIDTLIPKTPLMYGSFMYDPI